MRFEEHIGLDIGSVITKLVQLAEVSEGKFRVVAIASMETPTLGSQVETDLARSEALKKLIKDAKVSSRKVVVSLPESQVYTRVMEMPVLEEPELSSAIKWQAEQYIPVPLTDVVLKHQVLSTAEQNVPGAKMSVLLVAAPNALLGSYTAMLSRAGLEVIAIETEILAVARALVGSDAYSPTSLLVHMGAGTTAMCILRRGDLAVVSSIATGGEALSRAVAGELGLELAQAEEYKKSYGLDETKLDGKVVSAMKPVMELILAEVKRVLAFYSTHFAEEPVKRIVLSGGTALLPGLVSFWTNTLGLEVQLGNPFANMDLPPGVKAETAEIAPLYIPALGLAMKLT